LDGALGASAAAAIGRGRYHRPRATFACRGTVAAVIVRRGAAPTPLAQVLQREPAIAEALLLLASRHTRVNADAEDLVQDALVAGLARRDPPDANDLDGVQKFFGSILNGLAANRRRAARLHPATAYDDDVPPSSSRGVPHPERALAQREAELARRQEKADLRARLAGEPRVLALWDLVDAGVRGRAELAERLGCSPDDVSNLQRRITYHAKRMRQRTDEPARSASWA
jgi:DNA-directed RNA polymerase specialized sigma24 family protein